MENIRYQSTSKTISPSFYLRIDERVLLLVLGVCSMIIGNTFFLPLPSNKNTHICPPETNSSTFHSISPLGKNVSYGVAENGCCALDWCKEQPAMNEIQFVIGFCIIAAGFPFRVGLTQSLLTKILGPVQQVKPFLCLLDLHFLFQMVFCKLKMM